jgi:dihydroorotate dehydrogenase (NAD+) catalytic subunit
VLEYLMAGATAVQVGTASFIHPMAMPDLIRGLDERLDAEGWETASRVNGMLAQRREAANVLEYA